MTRRRDYEAPDLTQMLTRMARALIRRAEGGELEAVSALAESEAVLHRAVVDAARAAHDGRFAYSWTEIGNELGISRQAAQQRFGHNPCSTGRSGDGACEASSPEPAPGSTTTHSGAA